MSPTGWNNAILASAVVQAACSKSADVRPFA